MIVPFGIGTVMAANINFGFEINAVVLAQIRKSLVIATAYAH